MAIIDISLKRDKAGLVTNQASQYKPNDKEKDRIQEILSAFTIGRQIQQKPYTEFNDLSLIERQSADQLSFNAYVEPKSTDPDEAWKSRAIRPIVRNRIISIAAHITGALIFPQIFAQNDNDEEDKNAGEVMRDLIEWVSEQAEYAKTFVYGVIAALVNPAVIIHTEYSEVKRKVKEIQPDGTWKEKIMLDELFSGFKDHIVPVDEILIGDIYEHDIQRQPFIIWRKAIDWTTAVAKYGDKENFKSHVRPGLQVIFDANDGQYYEAYDESLQERLVEEVIFWHRMEDLRVVMVNGVLMTDADQPNPRQDKKYPFVKSGYELIDEGKFFYYSSLAKKLSRDEDVVNILYRMVIDGTFLQLMPPVAHYGEEVITSSVVTPGTVTTLNEGSKLERIDIGGNLSAGLAMLQKVEASISESSQDILQSGQATPGSQTAFEVSRLEANAKVMLGMFAKMIGFMVQNLGELKISDILQFLTVGQVGEITDNATNLKFASFLVPERQEAGKMKTRKIMFDNSLNEEENLERTEEDLSFETLEMQGGLESDMQIYRVNPTMFRKMKFKVKVTPDTVLPPSDNLKKALALELYDRAIQNPLADQEAITRDLLFGTYDKTKNNPDKYMRKMELGMPGMMPPGAAGGSPLSEILGAKKGTPNEMAMSV